MTSLLGRPRCEPSRLGRRALCLGAFVFACAATARAGEVRVQVTGTEVDLDATAAPLPEILDRLARPTGMKVVFDGAAPRPLVTISVHGRSPTQTVLAVLEGLGINYALLSDPSGIRVQTLLVSGTAAPAASARGPSPVLRGNRNMPMPPPEEMPDEEMPQAEDGPAPEPEMMSPVPPAPADTPPQGPSPAPTPAPQPSYTPGPLLPPAPMTVQPFRPFPAPTPTAPPQAGQVPEPPPPTP